MGKAKKNSYEKEAHKKQMLNGTFANALKGKDLSRPMIVVTDMVGGAIGLAAGAAIGRWSLLSGIAAIAAGGFLRNRAAGAFGIGMMAAGGYQVASSLKGTSANGIDGVKERLIALKDDLAHRLFLDKFIKSKKQNQEDDATNGVGEVQYFNHNKALEASHHFNTLDEIEKQIAAAADKHMRTNAISGGEDEMGAIEEHIL